MMLDSVQVEGRNADYHRIMDTVLETIHPQWANIANTNSGDSEILVNKAVLSPKPKKITRKNAAGNTKIGDKGTKLLKATSKAHESANQPRKRMYKHRANAFGGKMPTVSPRDGALVTELPFDAVIFFGDLNYRNDLPRLEIERLHNRLVKNAWMGNANKTTFPIYNVFEGKILHQQEQHDSLLSQMKVKFDNRYLRYATSPRKVLLEQQLDRVLLFDQLSRQRGAGAVFQNFLEGSIRFPPTYKYDEKRDLFDSSSKQRCPAWTDRILYYSRKSTSSTSSSSPECVFGNNKDSQDGKTSKLVDSGDTLRSNAGAEKRPTAEQVAVSLSEPIPTPSGNPSTVDLGGAASENDVLQLHDYYSIDARTSDHRPVCADFTLHL